MTNQRGNFHFLLEVGDVRAKRIFISSFLANIGDEHKVENMELYRDHVLINLPLLPWSID